MKVNHDGVLPPSPPTPQGLTVLLHGPPGTGKTLAAEAVGYEVGRPLKVRGVAVGGQGSQWVVVWVGLRMECGCGWGSEWGVVVAGAQNGVWLWVGL